MHARRSLCPLRFYRLPSTKWFLCMLTITLECYGWVALALPVYANVSWDPERPLNKPAHTGRASGTQPEAQHLIVTRNCPQTIWC